MPATIDPVVIFAHPAGEDTAMMMAMARYAVTQQRAPIVLHPLLLPWYRDPYGLDVAASEGARALLEMVARHTGGSLWVLLRPGEAWRDDAGLAHPRWTSGAVLAWERTAGKMPSRIRSGTAADWARHTRGLPNV